MHAESKVFAWWLRKRIFLGVFALADLGWSPPTILPASPRDGQSRHSIRLSSPSCILHLTWIDNPTEPQMQWPLVRAVISMQLPCCCG